MERTVKTTKEGTIGRRSVLRSATALGAVLATTAVAACAPNERSVPLPSQNQTAPHADPDTPGAGSRILLAYFSRAGENYYYGGRTDLDIGNTEVLAGTIAKLIPCDVHRIEAADPYPENYDATVARNVREQNADARPAIANPLPAIDQYDTILLASGIWNVRAPMIMTTFTESYDFTGKTIHPITTHAMSGIGNTMRDYTASCPGAEIRQGLAVKGEEVQKPARTYNHGSNAPDSSKTNLLASPAIRLHEGINS
jgi:flavodoxin